MRDWICRLVFPALLPAAAAAELPEPPDFVYPSTSSILPDESTIDQERFQGAIATNRIESARFSAVELDWAWHAINRHYNHDQFRDLLERKTKDGSLRPGLAEIAFRFGRPKDKLALLRALRGLGKHAPDEMVETAEIALRDWSAPVKAEAALLLLDHEKPVDSELLHEALDNEVYQRFSVLAPLLRMGDERGKAAFAEHLEKERNPKELLQAALDSEADVLAEIRPFVEADRDLIGDATWLRLGGSVQQLLDFRGGDISQISIDSMRLGRSLEILELRARREIAKGEAYPIEHSVRSVLEVARLTKSAPPQLDWPEFVDRAWVLALRANAGDEAALKQLAQFDWTERSGGSRMREIADLLAEFEPDETIVSILVRMTLRALDGFKWDDTMDGPTTVNHVTAVMRRLPDDLRNAALAQFVEQSGGPAKLAERPRYVFVEWALGRKLEAFEILQLHEHADVDFTDATGLGLDSEEIVVILRPLRADPAKHHFALGLARDETSAVALAGVMEQAVDANFSTAEASYQYAGALRAVRRIGSAAAVERLYEIAEKIRPHMRIELSEAIGELETEQIERLARSSLGPARETGGYWSHGLLIALGNRD